MHFTTPLVAALLAVGASAHLPFGANTSTAAPAAPLAWTKHKGHGHCSVEAQTCFYRGLKRGTNGTVHWGLKWATCEGHHKCSTDRAPCHVRHDRAYCGPEGKHGLLWNITHKGENRTKAEEVLDIVRVLEGEDKATLELAEKVKEEVGKRSAEETKEESDEDDDEDDDDEEGEEEDDDDDNDDDDDDDDDDKDD